MKKTNIIMITTTALATFIMAALPGYLLILGLQIGYAIALWVGFLSVAILSVIDGYQLKKLNPTSD